jgi:hypothetical protein
MLHTELPIHQAGAKLLSLALRVEEQMPRGMKRSLGKRLNDACVEMLDFMAMANATKGSQRAQYIQQVLARQRSLTVLLRVSHDNRFVSHKLWGESVLLLDSIGRQGGGWLKNASNKAPAA